MFYILKASSLNRRPSTMFCGHGRNLISLRSIFIVMFQCYHFVCFVQRHRRPFMLFEEALKRVDKYSILTLGSSPIPVEVQSLFSIHILETWMGLSVGIVKQL